VLPEVEKAPVPKSRPESASLLVSYDRSHYIYDLTTPLNLTDLHTTYSLSIHYLGTVQHRVQTVTPAHHLWHSLRASVDFCFHSTAL